MVSKLLMIFSVVSTLTGTSCAFSIDRLPSKLYRVPFDGLSAPLKATELEDVPESAFLREALDGKDILHYSLSNLRTFRSWDFSWPTITKPQRFTDRHNYASDEAFFHTIQHHNYGVTHGLLAAIGALDFDNSVVLYGGALVDIVRKAEDSIADFDLTLVGQSYVDSPDKCVDMVKKFVDDVFAWIKEENERIEISRQRAKARSNVHAEAEGVVFDIQQVKTIRNSNTITIVVPGRLTIGYQHITATTLQFTFAPHRTTEELLAHCLPHCTRLAIKDKAVILDASAKYCLESLCVVVDEKTMALQLRKKIGMSKPSLQYTLNLVPC